MRPRRAAWRAAAATCGSCRAAPARPRGRGTTAPSSPGCAPGRRRCSTHTGPTAPPRTDPGARPRRSGRVSGPTTTPAVPCSASPAARRPARPPPPRRRSRSCVHLSWHVVTSLIHLMPATTATRGRPPRAVPDPSGQARATARRGARALPGRGGPHPHPRRDPRRPTPTCPPTPRPADTSASQAGWCSPATPASSASRRCRTATAPSCRR